MYLVKRFNLFKMTEVKTIIMLLVVSLLEYYIFSRNR